MLMRPSFREIRVQNTLKGQIPGIFKLEDIRLLFPTKTDTVSCDKMTLSNQNKA